MTLLYLALGYLLGIIAGHLLWQAGFLDCALPGRLWLLPLAALPPALWWERRAPLVPTRPMRWPASAGFLPPKPAITTPLLLLLTLAFITGALRYASHPFQPCWTPGDLAYYNTTLPAAVPVTVTGYVNSYPLVEGIWQNLIVRVQEIGRGDDRHPVDGLLQIRTGALPRLAYGQPVQVTGTLQAPPILDEFDYRSYLAGQGTHSTMNRPRLDVLPGPFQGNPLLRAVYSLRSRGERLLQQRLPEPYAALANGMLLGVESDIPQELYDAYRNTGASHTIVISGSNVALLSGVILAAGVRLLGRRRAIWPALAGIALYTLLVGGDASVTRAALMGGMFVTATAIGRQSTALISLAAACWTMTLINPLALWNAGFQLSAAATAGLILLSPGFTKILDRLWPGLGQGGHLTGSLMTTGQNLIRGLVVDGLLMTLAATLTTMPVILYHFDRLNPVTLVTNLLITPVQPFILLGGSLGLLIGLLGLGWLAQVVLWIPYLGLVWTVGVVRWADRWPVPDLAFVAYGLDAALLTYGVMALVLRRSWLRRQGQRLWRRLTTRPAPGGSRPQMAASTLLANSSLVNTALGLLAAAAVVVWWMAATQPDGRLHVYFLDVGQGDGLLVQTPSGRQLLIDGGRDPQVLFNELGQAMPFWDRSLDLLLLTHPDQDHMDAQLAIPDRYDVDGAVAGAATLADGDGQPWAEAMAAAGIPVTVGEAGGWIDLGDGVALWLLWPPQEAALAQTGIATDDKNERSLVAMLVYGELRLLLTGDAGLPTERALLNAGAPLGAMVLKVGHHGSDTSTGREFVAAVNPAIAVIGVGRENGYGHPAPGVLDTLAGRAVLRTDDHGQIHLWSDGSRLWIEVEQGQLPWYTDGE